MNVNSQPTRLEPDFLRCRHGLIQFQKYRSPRMFSFLAKKKPSTATINAQSVTVQPKETLLQAALRDGIAFPYSCRVGGCATCKCKLVHGKVKELTEASYVLSDAELDQGYILACQSVPQGDVTIEVDLGSQPARRQVSGRVIGQDRLTRDITRVRVQLDEALAYKAGQFADISLASLPGVQRSYSFATPAQADAQVVFFVRHVPGGVFSTTIHEQNVMGQTLTVDGPLGDFWLRPGTSPLILIAGGSGLAPMLALLKDAANQGGQHSVTLLFGARTQQDLYALDEIEALSQQWAGRFRFMPVLSAEPADSNWAGARGLVSDQIPQLIEAGSQAYLCGPPAMIDHAMPVLKLHGVRREDIFADRFSTQHDALPVAA